MEGNTTPAPKPNAFVIPDDEAYAMTDIHTFEAVEFLTKLKPVDLDVVGPDDALCPICHQDYRLSKPSHAPVKTPCGHIFGRECIVKWLDPLSHRGSELGDLAASRTNCPVCRHGLVPPSVVEPREFLAQRLEIWDAAYASVGAARSEREEQSRSILWAYVDGCPATDELEHHRAMARAMLMRWLHGLRLRELTVEQEVLRQELIQFAWQSVPWDSDSETEQY